jgi:acetylornithine/N-succinyldiaminopimelate aminotransferase
MVKQRAGLKLEILYVLCEPGKTIVLLIMNHRELFYTHLAQTSAHPLALEIVQAEDCILYDADGKEYLDLIGGISVANTGHRHPVVLDAIRKQLDAYLHVMVYGEFIQSPQVQYAKLLTSNLPSSLNSVYFTSSGSEAVEGALKLAKRATGRTNVIAFDNAYHGSTQGALSIIGDEYWRNAFRPLLPGVLHAKFNESESLNDIDGNTACVVVETVQAEAGIISPSGKWLKALRQRCTETGTLLMLDEIQAGFGRTGKLWGFEHFDIVPDVLLLGKALGGGMPLGAFIAERKLMHLLSGNPVLGHITSFGGHPVSCAAGKASLEVLLNENLMRQVKQKEELFRSLLVHSSIKSTRSFGLWMAIEVSSPVICKKLVDACIADGVLIDWFLFAPQCLRISPPLTISELQIKKACSVIMQAVQDHCG